ncbi:MAG: hypothetical protein RLZZ330_231 [Actinomycetota bacterium]
MKLVGSLPESRMPSPQDAPAIRWGVIAPGGIAHAFASAVNDETNSRIAAVGSRSLERAKDFAAKFEKDGAIRAYGSYEELVQDDGIDAVYVASPHSEHHAHVSLALNAGKPVLVEKAFTQNAKQAVEIVELARSKNLLLVEAMWTRFLPHIDVVRQLVENGEIGNIQKIFADHGQEMHFPPEHRLQNPALAGGALLDLGIYPLSFMHMLMGNPDSVTAIGTLSATGVDESMDASLMWGEVQGVLATTQKMKTPTSAIVLGDVASIKIPGDFYQPNEVHLIYPDGTHLQSRPTAVAGLAYEAAEFARLLAVGADESDLMTHADSISIMRIMDEMRAHVGVNYPGD